MKQILLTAAVALTTLGAPALAMNVDMSSLTPVLTFPEPAPEPVTQGAGGIDAQ